MAITLDNVIQSAIEVLNREGVGKLSMRTLADALNVRAASLYWHVKNKQELYGMIAETLCAGIQAVEEGDPKTRLISLNVQYRNSLLSVRDSVTIFEESLPNTPRRMALVEMVEQALLAWGIGAAHLPAAANMLNNYVLSFTADEIRLRNQQPSEEEPAVPSEATSPEEMDRRYHYGLEVLLAGFRMMETASSGRE